MTGRPSAGVTVRGQHRLQPAVALRGGAGRALQRTGAYPVVCGLPELTIFAGLFDQHLHRCRAHLTGTIRMTIAENRRSNQAPMPVHFIVTSVPRTVPRRMGIQGMVVMARPLLRISAPIVFPSALTPNVFESIRTNLLIAPRRPSPPRALRPCCRFMPRLSLRARSRACAGAAASDALRPYGRSRLWELDTRTSPSSLHPVVPPGRSCRPSPRHGCLALLLALLAVTAGSQCCSASAVR